MGIISMEHIFQKTKRFAVIVGAGIIEVNHATILVVGVYDIKLLLKL
jgi:hypothetical protein